MGKHIVTLNRAALGATRDAHRECEGCQTSCQSACKTSCTVGNQVCPREKKEKKV
ncbi:MAG: six-cysteine ranthipeptide SCIFF [Peptococcaceae bacterium]|nr:six-cysteine ranthipeptide SCIFF [Peptococcaceae bacterium]